MNLLIDLKYALRTLRRNPAYTVAAVLTLALGIGANSAIFSLMDSCLLRPLPYRDPGQLVVLWESTREGGRGAVAMANYRDWARQSSSFEALAAWTPNEVDLKLGNYRERARGELTTQGYFSLLGVSPELGREFGLEEETAHAVVIVSDAFWRSRMRGSTGAIGSTVELGGTPFTVIGVAPKGFQGLSGQAEIWTPIAAYNLMYPQLAKFDFPNSRDVHFMSGLGRLKAGVTAQAAALEMKTIGDRLAAQYPNENRNRGVALEPAQADLAREVKPALEALMAAVGLVLLVACANVANLMLVRLSQRQHEVAVRTALGAKRWHLLRELWSETGVVTAAGGGLGLGLFAAVRGSWNSFLPLTMPKFALARFDTRLLLFAVAITFVTGSVLTLVPLAEIMRGAIQPQLAAGARSSDPRSVSKIRGLLVISEVSLAVVLTTGAGLMIRSLWRMQHADLGFRTDHLATLRFDVPANKYSGESRYALPERVAEQMQSVPGVVSAGVTSADLLVWPGLNRGFEIEGHEPYRNQFEVYFQDVTPGFFRTAGIPLLAGRDFTSADNSHSLPVVIVSRAFARQYLPGQDAIGKRLRFGGQQATWRVIVGVVGDAQIEDVHRDRAEVSAFYSPMRDAEVIISGSLMVRTVGPAARRLPSLRAALQSFDQDFTIYNVDTLEERITANGARTRGFTLLMAMFGTIAVSLALLGTYGVIAYSVTQRTRELGIRMALGASPGNVERLVTAQGARMVMAGTLIGLGLSLGLTRYLATMLFKVAPRDPEVLTVITVLVGIAGLGASYLPARRAGKADTAAVLRAE